MTPRSWPKPSRSMTRRDVLLRDPLREQLGVEERAPSDLQVRDAPVARQLVDGRAWHAQDLGDLSRGEQALHRPFLHAHIVARFELHRRRSPSRTRSSATSFPNMLDEALTSPV